MAYDYFNDEQKIRIALSPQAEITMHDDMEKFGITKEATFINTVFSNYKYEAKASICQYEQQRFLELDNALSFRNLDSETKRSVLNTIIEFETAEIKSTVSGVAPAGKSKLYHINDTNTEFLLEDCDENKYYSRPSLYIRAVIEEYCRLPLIKRQRIIQKEIFDIVERACSEKRILKIKTPLNGQEQLFYVYPYKIIPDTLHTQLYLACYSKKDKAADSEKVLASFSMIRLAKPTMLSKTFHLNKAEIKNIEDNIAVRPAAYLISQPEKIKVRLTEAGKKAYHSRIFNRPEKIDALSKGDIYVFDCSQYQAFNFFFSFGADAEIISPKELKEQFKKAYEEAFLAYNKCLN